MLKELAEIGMELARGLVQRVAGPDVQLAFARVSRAVRQIVALNAHLRLPPRQPSPSSGAAKAGAASVQGEASDGSIMDPAMRARVVARVQSLCRKSEMAGRLTAAIEFEAVRGDRERLLADLDRRLDVAVNSMGFLERPFEAVIAEIRHDLGLGPSPSATEGAGDDQQDDPDDDDDEPGWFGEPPGDGPGGDAAPDRPRRGSG